MALENSNSISKFRKMAVVAITALILIVQAMAWASPKGPIWKNHKGKQGLKGQKITCVYCHGKDRANIPKKKGIDIKQTRKGAYCALKDCHE